ncbi:MAG: dihydroorotase [Actinomycetota bacterium]|nr:dihydroorotase [Actinomycetota bacterium]
MNFGNLKSKSKENILIRNGCIINPKAQEKYKADILVLDGIIKEIKKNITCESADNIQEINAEGLYVCPGFVDMHVHLREPGNEEEEDIESGAKSALRGGITSMACMPNTLPVIDSCYLVEYIKMKAREIDYNVYPVAAITKSLKGEELSEIGLLVNSGAVAFSDDGKGVQNSRLMYEAMRYGKQFDALFILHEEDDNFSNGGIVNEGYYSAILGLEGISNLSEDLMVQRDIMLSKISGARIHITHVSSARSVELIYGAKADGVNITCDTACEYLFFNDSILTNYDTNFKIKPPIRSESDRLAIVEGLRNGTIDAIASDHAPHLLLEKNKSFKEASFGSVGLETLFKASLTKLFYEENLSLEKIVALISLNPAKILNIEGGELKTGSIANISVVDIESENIYSKDSIISKSKNSSFIGQKLNGEIMYTIVNGKSGFSNS